jgi:hypothetical protein
MWATELQDVRRAAARAGAAERVRGAATVRGAAAPASASASVAAIPATAARPRQRGQPSRGSRGQLSRGSIGTHRSGRVTVSVWPCRGRMEGNSISCGALGMRVLSEYRAVWGLRRANKRQLDNNRINNNTSCGRCDSAGGRGLMDAPRAREMRPFGTAMAGAGSDLSGNRRAGARAALPLPGARAVAPLTRPEAASGVRGNRRGVPGIDRIPARLAHQPCLEAMPAVMLENHRRPVIAR